MINIKEFIYKNIWMPSEEKVLEMASIGYPILNKERYLVAVHGLNANERNRPHFHIYIGSDKSPYNKFNFEIALDEILCYDEINIIKMRDLKRGILYNNRNKCSWNNYTKLYSDFEDWLFDTNVEKRGDFIDNLDSIIYFYNQESGSIGLDKNAILEYIKNHGMKVLDKYKKYFSEEDINKYKECFN